MSNSKEVKLLDMHFDPELDSFVISCKACEKGLLQLGHMELFDHSHVAKCSQCKATVTVTYEESELNVLLEEADEEGQEEGPSDHFLLHAKQSTEEKAG